MVFTKILALWEASCCCTLLLRENIRSMYCAASARHNLCAIGPTMQRHVTYRRTRGRFCAEGCGPPCCRARNASAVLDLFAGQPKKTSHYLPETDIKTGRSKSAGPSC